MFGYTVREAVGQHISLIIPVNRRDEETNDYGFQQTGDGSIRHSSSPESDGMARYDGHDVRLYRRVCYGEMNYSKSASDLWHEIFGRRLASSQDRRTINDCDFEFRSGFRTSRV